MVLINTISVIIIALIGIGNDIIIYVVNCIAISILSSSSVRWHIYGMDRLFRKLGIRMYNHYAYNMYVAVYGDVGQSRHIVQSRSKTE